MANRQASQKGRGRQKASKSRRTGEVGPMHERERTEEQYMEEMRRWFESDDLQGDVNFNKCSLINSNGQNTTMKELLQDKSKATDGYRKKWAKWAVSDIEFVMLVLLVNRTGKEVYFPATTRPNVLDVLEVILERGDVDDVENALTMLLIWGGPYGSHEGVPEDIDAVETNFYNVLNSNYALSTKAQAMKNLVCMCGYFCKYEERRKSYNTLWINISKTIHMYLDKVLAEEELDTAEESYLESCVISSACIIPYVTKGTLMKNLSQLCDNLNLLFELSESPDIKIAVAESMLSIMDVAERIRFGDTTMDSWKAIVLNEAKKNSDETNKQRWELVAQVLESGSWVVEVKYFKVDKNLKIGHSMPKSRRDSNLAAKAYPDSHWGEFLWFRLVKSLYGQHFNVVFNKENAERSTEGWGRRTLYDRVREILEQGAQGRYNEGTVASEKLYDARQRDEEPKISGSKRSNNQDLCIKLQGTTLNVIKTLTKN